MGSVENILDLPTEILTTIFTYLLPSDRRVASECCKRFLDIWLRDIFIDDRRLVFNKFVLDPETLSIFSQSQRNYRHLVFGEVVLRVMRDPEFRSKFVATFAETVTTIEFKNSFIQQRYIFPYLSLFPNLKTIKAEYFHTLGDLSRVPTNIETLIISNYFWRISNKDYIIEKLANYLDETSDSFRIELEFDVQADYILKFTDSQRNKIQRVGLWFNIAFKLPRFENLKYLYLKIYDCFLEDIIENIEEQLPALQYVSEEGCYVRRLDASILAHLLIPKKKPIREDPQNLYICVEDINEIETLPLMLHVRKAIIRLPRFDFESVKIFEKVPAVEDLTLKYYDIKDDYRLSMINFQTMAKSLKRLVNFKLEIFVHNHDFEWLLYEHYSEIIDILATHCKYLKHIHLPYIEYCPSKYWKELLQKHSTLRSINSMWHFKSEYNEATPVNLSNMFKHPDDF